MKFLASAFTLIVGCAHCVEAEAALRTFRKWESFTRVTGSVSATGPIQNLGQVAAGPSESVRLGNLTLSPAPGIDPNTLLFGDGPLEGDDWTCLNPGFEMAMGNEALRVKFDEPLTAMGFYFVEPNETICGPVCGTPVDSTFEVTLYAGATVVGQFTFNGRDDERVFIGVESDDAFDTADIVDTTGDHDDEYFGEFFAPLTAPDCSEE